MSAALLLLVLSALGSAESARILGAVPFPAVSHQVPLRTILLELAKRGHEVTFITTNPLKKTIANYTEIDISDSYKYIRSATDWMAMAYWTPIDMMLSLEALGNGVCEYDLNAPEMKKFIKSAPKFDVVILERLLTPCFYGLVHAVGSPPLIGYVSLGASSPVHWDQGNPSNPAYLPDWILPYSDHMSFWQRLYSTYVWIRQYHFWYNVILPNQEEIQRKHFSPAVPPLSEVEKNFSLVLMNNHFSIDYPRPNLPNMVELTGLHVEHKRKPLPTDVQDWLDGADEGVVYFSLGSTLPAVSMPEEKRRAFVGGFAQIRQRVLWKWESDNVTDLPPNVKISKWLPQQDILAHPNVKVFITQGGLQSFNEAAYHGVPLIGIPMLGDQPHNVAKMVAAGIGKELKFWDVTKDTVSETIRAVVEDDRYRETMKRFSAVYREHQAESLPRAVWWVEYVLRHRGAPHLRSAALDLSWYQLLLLDVVAFVFAIVAASCVALYLLARFLISKVYTPKKVKSQ